MVLDNKHVNENGCYFERKLVYAVYWWICMLSAKNETGTFLNMHDLSALWKFYNKYELFETYREIVRVELADHK